MEGGWRTEREEENGEGEQRKVLLEGAGTVCYAAFIGSNPVVETLIQKGVGEKICYKYSTL